VRLISYFCSYGFSLGYKKFFAIKIEMAGFGGGGEEY